MSGIFLKHPKNTLVQIDTTPKVNLSTIIRVVSSIVPPNSTPLNYKRVDQGYSLSFVNDKDINHFYSPANLNKLKEYNLSPTLSPNSKNNREIYIPGITKFIYYLPKDKLIAEIKQKNNIDCLFISFFTSPGGTRYLVITADSRVSRDNIIKKTVTLFDTEYKPQPKLQTRSQEESTSLPYNGRVNRAPITPSHYSQARRDYRSPSSSWRDPPSPTYEFYRTPSAQSNKVALPSNSSWAVPRRTVLAPSHADTPRFTVLQPRARTSTLTVNKTSACALLSTVTAPRAVHQPSSPSTCVPRYPKPPPTIISTPEPQQYPVASPVVVQPHTPLQPVQQEPQPPMPAATTRPLEHQQPKINVPTPLEPTKPLQQEPLGPQSSIHILSTISEALSKGIEHPLVYMDILNILLTQHGYTNLTLPKHVLNMSRNVFFHKNPDRIRTTIPFEVLHKHPASSIPTFPITVHTST